MNTRLLFLCKRTTLALTAIATFGAWLGLASQSFAQSTSLQFLGGSRHDGPGRVAASDSSFGLGISRDDGATFDDSALLSETVLIRGRIQPEAADIGKRADIFLVDRLEDDNSFLMRTTSGVWVPWNGSVATLQPFLEEQVLTATLDLDLFTGTLGSAGTHRIFLGYMAADGILRYHVDGLALTIMQAPEDLTGLVERVRAQHGMPAMAGAIVTRDGIVAIGVSGTRRASGGTAVTLDDKWHIGSNLKAITAMLAAIAVDQGAISWDTTVGPTYPEWPWIRQEHRNVTLADLLGMRAGLVANSDDGFEEGTTARQQRDWAAGWALFQPRAAPFGTFYYSNLSYILAGSMIERALGGNYEDLIVERIAQPLGVAGIGWGSQATQGSNDQPVPHRRERGRWVEYDSLDNPPGASSAGRAHLPLKTWAAIISELLRATAGESTLITSESAERLFTGDTYVQANYTYAMGWTMTSRWWDPRVATHSGSNTLNYSVAWLGLEEGVAFLALTNAGDAAGSDHLATDQLAEAMTRLYYSRQE